MFSFTDLQKNEVNTIDNHEELTIFVKDIVCVQFCPCAQFCPKLDMLYMLYNNSLNNTIYIFIYIYI